MNKGVTYLVPPTHKVSAYCSSESSLTTVLPRLQGRQAAGCQPCIGRRAGCPAKKAVAGELQLHGDQVFQYVSQAYFALTQEYGVTPSPGTYP